MLHDATEEDVSVWAGFDVGAGTPLGTIRPGGDLEVRGDFRVERGEAGEEGWSMLGASCSSETRADVVERNAHLDLANQRGGQIFAFFPF